MNTSGKRATGHPRYNVIRMARPVLFVSLCGAALAGACSLAHLDYLRDPRCAPDCGAPPAEEAASDAQTSTDASDGGLSDACPTGAGYSALVLCDRPIAYFRLGEPPGSVVAANEVEGGVAGSYVSGADGGISYQVEGAVYGDSNTAISLGGDGRVTVPGDQFAFAD